MNTQPVLVVLRLIHVVAGVLWVGGAAVLAFFVLPAARGDRDLSSLREIIWTRNLPRYLNVTLSLALLSGLLMYGNLVKVTYGAYAKSRVGMALGAGGGLAILAALVATFVAAPAVHRALELDQSSPGDSSTRTMIDASLKRYAAAMRLVVALLIGTAALMATARYL